MVLTKESNAIFIKKCRKIFDDLTHSPNYNRKKSVDLWIHYATCMIAGYSIAKCDKEVGISIPTAFYCRYKIDAIKEYRWIRRVDGVVEIDVSFIRASYKNCHTKNSVF